MNQKGFANIVLVLISVILAGAVGYFVFVKRYETVTQQPTTPTPSVKQTPTPQTPAPTPVADETANWKIYRNDQFGFEVRYKSDWKIKESWPEIVQFCPSSCRRFFHGDIEIQNLSTYKYKSYEDFKTLCSKGLGAPLFNPGSINEENKYCRLTVKDSILQQAKESDEQAYSDFILIYSDTGNHIGIVKYDFGRVPDKEFEIMISTFKLIPAMGTPTL